MYPLVKLTQEWKADLFKIYSLLKMGIFYCHGRLQESCKPPVMYNLSRFAGILLGHFWVPLF